jgi:hypothetical protein
VNASQSPLGNDLENEIGEFMSQKANSSIIALNIGPGIWIEVTAKQKSDRQQSPVASSNGYRKAQSTIMYSCSFNFRGVER